MELAPTILFSLSSFKRIVFGAVLLLFFFAIADVYDIGKFE